MVIIELIDFVYDSNFNKKLLNECLLFNRYYKYGDEFGEFTREFETKSIAEFRLSKAIKTFQKEANFKSIHHFIKNMKSNYWKNEYLLKLLLIEKHYDIIKFLLTEMKFDDINEQIYKMIILIIQLNYEKKCYTYLSFLRWLIGRLNRINNDYEKKIIEKCIETDYTDWLVILKGKYTEEYLFSIGRRCIN